MRAIPAAVTGLGSTFFAGVASVGTWITSHITGAVSGIGTSVANLVKGIPAAVVALGRSAFSGVASVGSWILSHIVDGVSDVAAKVVTIVKAIPTAIVALGAKAFASVETVGTWVKNAIVDGVTGVANRVKDIVGNIPGAVHRDRPEVLRRPLRCGRLGQGRHRRRLQEHRRRSCGSSQGSIQSLVDLVNGAIGKVNSALSFTIPGLHFDTHIPGVGKVGFDSFTFDPPDIPPIKLAAGGIVTQPTTALIRRSRPRSGAAALRPRRVRHALVADRQPARCRTAFSSGSSAP